MLSKQVKQRRRANRAKRRLCANKETRARVHLAIRSGCHQQLLSSKHFEVAEAKLDAWSDFKGVIFEDADFLAPDKTWGMGLQQRMIDSEDRRRANIGALFGD